MLLVAGCLLLDALLAASRGVRWTVFGPSHTYFTCATLVRHCLLGVVPAQLARDRRHCCEASSRYLRASRTPQCIHVVTFHTSFLPTINRMHQLGLPHHRHMYASRVCPSPSLHEVFSLSSLLSPRESSEKHQLHQSPVSRSPIDQPLYQLSL